MNAGELVRNPYALGAAGVAGLAGVMFLRKRDTNPTAGETSPQLPAGAPAIVLSSIRGVDGPAPYGSGPASVGGNPGSGTSQVEAGSQRPAGGVPGPPSAPAGHLPPPGSNPDPSVGWTRTDQPPPGPKWDGWGGIWRWDWKINRERLPGDTRTWIISGEN